MALIPTKAKDWTLVKPSFFQTLGIIIHFFHSHLPRTSIKQQQQQ